MASFAGMPLTPAEKAKILASPAMMPPPGMTSNFDDPYSLTHTNRVVTAVVVSISGFCLIMRMVAQHYLVRKYHLEDLIIGLAFIVLVLFAGLGNESWNHGIGWHMWDVTIAQLYRAQKWLNYCAICYALLVVLLKVAILLQIIRLFAPVRQLNMRLWVSSYVWIVAMSLFYTAIFAATIAQCVPRSGIWDPFVKAKCLDAEALYKATGVFNIISDFVIFVIPIPDIYSLRVPIKKKLLILCVFATGLFACGTSIVRTYYTWQIYGRDDLSWTSGVMSLWTYGEVVAGFVVFSLPIAPKFTVFLRERFPDSPIQSLLRSTRRSNRNSSSQRSGPSDFEVDVVKFQENRKKKLDPTVTMELGWLEGQDLRKAAANPHHRPPQSVSSQGAGDDQLFPVKEQDG